MIVHHSNQQATPSVYFNFDYSNQKTNEKGLGLDRSYVPFDYSFSTNKNMGNEDDNQAKIFYNCYQNQCKFVTPPSYLRNFSQGDLIEKEDLGIGVENCGRNTCNLDKMESICVKLDTQEFFDEFDKNFVINFGESSTKNKNNFQLRKTFESCPGGNTVKDSFNSKVQSYISQPIVRRLSIQPIQNQQDLAVTAQIRQNQKQQVNLQAQKTLETNRQKQNKPPSNVVQKMNKKQSKFNCQIRKRILLKNNEKLITKLSKNKSKYDNNLIKKQNLLIVTSSNWERWTQMPQQRKNHTAANSQPIKRDEKSIKKTESNIFSSRRMFKETLRSTTLDNWKKKFNFHKNEQKGKAHNIFQKPFSLLR